MFRFAILLVFFFIQFNEQQAASIPLTSLDENEEPLFPSPMSSAILNLWYNHRLNDLQENDQERDVEQLWKRYSPELIPIRQRRRFGNTRYGRSLPTDTK